MAELPSRITWKIEEYTHHEKGPDWFWALGVIAIAGAAIAIVYHDTFFAVFIILAAGILGWYAARPPEIMEVAINENGIKVNKHIFLFKKLKGFAVEETELGNHLIIESDRVVAPVISFPLPASLNTEGLRELLRTKIEEKPIKLHFSHNFMEHLGF